LRECTVWHILGITFIADDAREDTAYAGLMGAAKIRRGITFNA